MKRSIGQSLRLGGMLIEMLGVMGVVTGKGEIESARMHLPGGTAISPAWIAVVVGFGLFAVGRILISTSRPSRIEL